MLDRILTYMKFGNRFCGVEHSHKNGEVRIISTVLKKSKRELDIEDSFEVRSINGLKTRLGKDQTAHLVINDRQVLTKQLESEQADNVKLVGRAFPNIDVQDFFYEILHQGNQHFISICRRDHVEKLIGQYQENRILITSISLGSLIISTLKDFIGPGKISTSSSDLVIEDGQINSITPRTEDSTDTYNVNGLQVGSDQLPSFSGALQNALKNRTVASNLEGRVQELRTEFNHLRFFNLFLRSGLGFIFILLLANFLVFNHYFNRVGDLRQLSQVNQSSRERLIGLRETVDKSERMVDDILKGNTSKSSFYADDIIRSMPGSVLLGELNYQPLSKRIKQGQPIEVENNSIVVSGASSDSDAYSAWISDLENRPWVRGIKTVSYGDRSRTVADFSFKILLGDGR